MTAVAFHSDIIYLPRSKYTIKEVKSRSSMITAMISAILNLVFWLDSLNLEIRVELDFVALLFNALLEIDLYIIQIRYYLTNYRLCVI